MSVPNIGALRALFSRALPPLGVYTDEDIAEQWGKYLRTSDVSATGAQIEHALRLVGADCERTGRRPTVSALVSMLKAGGGSGGVPAAQMPDRCTCDYGCREGEIEMFPPSGSESRLYSYWIPCGGDQGKWRQAHGGVGGKQGPVSVLVMQGWRMADQSPPWSKERLEWVAARQRGGMGALEIARRLIEFDAEGVA